MWPFTINTLISLDGGSPTLVDSTDHSSEELIDGPETVASSVAHLASVKLPYPKDGSGYLVEKVSKPEGR